MKIQVISLFPQMFEQVLNTSMLFKARNQNIVDISYIDLRDYGVGPRKQVDDTPYGGGDGMLIKPEPMFGAIEQAKKNDQSAEVILLTPRGELYSQKKARSLAKEKGLIFVCARYEGYDERISSIVDEQISIGEYVLTGGEIPAMVIVDSIVRLLPGVLGGEKSAEIESFTEEGILEFPQYTRPENYKGMKAPEVLLSGNHQEIEQWRKNNQTNLKKSK